MVYINKYVREASKERGYAVFPDDFPHLRDTGKDFVAWREGADWHVETIVTGDVLQERMSGLNKFPESRYYAAGNRDSDTHGWMMNQDPETTAHIVLDTPEGSLIAKVAPDAECPGIYLTFKRLGEDREQTVALLQAAPGEDVSLRVWEHERKKEAYQHQFYMNGGLDCARNEEHL